MIKILAIGNSFSQDTTRYLYDIAASANQKLMVVNLFIGGCSLKMHCDNIENDKNSYSYELNGVATERFVSIKEALLEQNWDIVTLQQVSHESGVIDRYYPYIKTLSEYVSLYAKNAKQLIHQTWAYEQDSQHESFDIYEFSQAIMYEKLKQAYLKISNELGLKIIPCGDVVQEVRKIDPFIFEKGGISLCRDGFHLSLDFGRYLAGAVWYETITKNSILETSFNPCKSEEETLILRKLQGIIHSYLKEKNA